MKQLDTHGAFTPSSQEQRIRGQLFPINLHSPHDKTVAMVYIHLPFDEKIYLQICDNIKAPSQNRSCSVNQCSLAQSDPTDSAS